MVGSLLILKMMHNKKKRSHSKRRKRSTLVEAETLQKNNYEATKTELSERVCRVCLKDGKLPIFSNDETQLCESLNTLGGIQVRADDPYPKYLCQACHALLQGALLLRKTAEKSNILLLKTYTIRKSEFVAQWEADETLSDVLNNESETSKYDGSVKSPKILLCERCNLNFESYEEYNRHAVSSEHENMRITCKICKNTYAPLYFKKHMALHTNEMSFMCDICGKKFFMQSQFNRHRLTHFYDLPFQCELCPYRGRFSQSLKLHMRSHTGEKPYQCAQCPSRFINKSNLNKHLLTHKKQHDFQCEICNRGFYTNRELELHTKVDHRGLREHVCGTCGKAFGYRKQMMKHELMVHKREKLKSGRMPIYLKVETMKQQNLDVPLSQNVEVAMDFKDNVISPGHMSETMASVR